MRSELGRKGHGTVKREPRRIAITVALVVLVAANILAQAALHRAGLDDQVVNAYSLSTGDAYGYASRGAAIAEGGSFADVFRDGHRMPGYPMFLSLFYRLSDRPMLAARWTQIVLTSLLIAVSYACLRAFGTSSALAIVGSAALAVWLPLYSFSPLIIAEGLSLLLVGVLCLLTVRLGDDGMVFAVLSGFCLAALVYLKPNHVLIVPPFLASSLYALRARGVGRAWLRVSAAVLVLVLLILPWSILQSSVADGFVPLSSAQGGNLYLGTGAASARAVASARGIHGDAAASLGLIDKERDRGVYEAAREMAPHEASDHYARAAMALWRESPGRQSLYGLSKVLHAFGFSLRDARDVVVVLHLAVSLAASVVLWARRRHRSWCVFLWCTFLVVAAQAFAFLPHQRFKVVLFDVPALLAIILASGAVLERVRLTLRARPAGRLHRGEQHA
jgi:4-amino-4-deoxy-L-arabinose transferase-like glycosyltransferase